MQAVKDEHGVQVVVDSQGTKNRIWDFEKMRLAASGSNETRVVYTLTDKKYE